MADKITNDITLLFKTKLDDKSKQEVGKNLKGLLENAVIDFDEAEIKRNLVPIINMIRVLFEKADMKFDADKLLQMPSRQALQKVADMSAQEFQNAFEKALAKNGGLSLGFDDLDTSEITTSLNNLTKEVSKISKQVTNTTKKSVNEIERSIKALDKLPKKDAVRKAATADSIEDTLVDYSSDKKLSSGKAITALDHARQAYEKSVSEKNPWVVQYKYLLDFVSKYEKLNHKTMERVEKEMPEFRDLYNRLAPHAGNVRESLEDYVVTIKGGGELSQYKNQPWGRETTLKEIRDTLKNGISVKDVDGDKEDSTRDSVKSTLPANDAEDNNAPVVNKPKVEDVSEHINTENLANNIVDAVVEPVLTDLEKQILSAVEDAKTKTSRKWDNVSRSDQEKWIAEALESRLTLSPLIDDDSMDELLFDVVGYSNGVGEISDISDAVSKWVVSIEDEFNKAEDEVKELVRSFAKIDDETSDDAWQISEQIADRNELLNELIIQDKNDSWSKFKDKLLGKTPSRSELLPTMEGIEQGAMEPSDEQKEYVLKLGEEYRSIVSILENSDNEFTDALKERASAIKEIMHAINIQDGFLDQTYTGTYGGDSKTASVLMDWRKEDELFLDRYDSSKIDDGARQTVIDLIHQETEARKQSIEVKREENIVDQQQNIDALKSKYESAAEQEKALVQDVINIRKEERSLEQFDDDASEEALDKLMSERLNKTKALIEINKDLWDAITSVGRDEIEKHIDTAPIVPEVASSVDTTASQEQLGELKKSVDNVTAAVGVKTQEFQGEETAVKNVVENEQKQLGDLKDSVEAVTNEIKTKTQEFLNEQVIVKRVSQSETHAIGEIEKKVKSIQTALSSVNTLLKNVKSGVDIDSGLSNITVNIHHQNDDQQKEIINNTVGNVLATENTLSAIKKAVENIDSKVVKGTKAKTYSAANGIKTGIGRKNAEDYANSKFFPEKLKTQTMYLAKFRAQLMTTGKLTDDVDDKIYELLEGLSQVKNGPDFSKWNQQFLQLKTSVGIGDIFEKAEDKITTASYEELIQFQETRNKLELKYQKAQDGTPLKQFYAEQLTQMDGVIAKQEEILENEEYEAKLSKMRIEQERKLGEVKANAETKDIKKKLADDKKLAKRQAMAGKAGSAIGRAESVWLEADGLDKSKIPDDFKGRVKRYSDELDNLKLKHHEISISDVVTEQQQKDLIAQTKIVNKLTEEIGDVVSEYQKLSGMNVDEEMSVGTNIGQSSNLSDYETALKQYVKEITHGKGQIKGFNASTKTLTYTVKTGKNEFTEYTAAVRHLDKQLVSVRGTTKRTETFLEATTRKMRELTSYFSGMAVFNFAKQELRRGIQYVREIDLALTELKKVTDETEESYDKFLDTAAKTGARLGTTISAVTEATATFAKLGYSMEQATKMAEAAIVYKNVGDNIASTEDAADSIISTMKGFRLEASESMAIVDRFNEVGKSIAHVIQ